MSRSKQAPGNGAGGYLRVAKTRTLALWLGWLALFLSLFASSDLTAQLVSLEEMEMVNLGQGYRIYIQCTDAAKFSANSLADGSRLEILFFETRLNLKRNNLRYKNTPVSLLTASQWKVSPPVVKVEIALTRRMEYEVLRRMGGLFYVELRESNEPSQDLRIDLPNQSNGGSVGQNGDSYSNGKSSGFLNSTRIENATHDLLPDPLATNDRISLEAKDAQITDVLRLLAKQTKLNIVAISDTGRVTVNLEDVSVREALDLIAKANGYDYTVNGDVILVKPWEKFRLAELQTKVYRLKYIDAQNLRTAVTDILSKQARVQVFYNDFNAAAAMQAEAASSGRADRRSSTLVVTDTPLNLKQLDAMVAALDVSTPQIMIEAKLIEISPQDEERLGIDWSKTVSAEIFQQVILPGGTQQRYSAEVPLDGGSVSFGTLNLGQYNAALDFLKAKTNAKLVSNPRILAMDNQTSMISVGQNIPIPQINRGVGGQGDIVSFEYRDFNISLEVTPHVAEEDIVFLRVNPIVEEIVGEVVAGEASAPVTSRREVETFVNLRSEETMVIGGLIKENTIETTSKVWLLGDIPLLGNLFRHKIKTKQQTDLLIFITPRLL